MKDLALYAILAFMVLVSVIGRLWPVLDSLIKWILRENEPESTNIDSVEDDLD